MRKTMHMNRMDKAEMVEFDPIAKAHELGIRSNHAYAAGFFSIALSLAAWIASRGAKQDRAQADRWGIFVGHWAPTFFVIGLALKKEEKKPSVDRAAIDE
jgi:hypothetical protein